MNSVENSLPWMMLNHSLGELFGLIVAVILAILAMAWMIMKIRARFTDRDDPAEGDHQLLISIRDLKREGDLTDDEYRSIKSRLVNRLGNGESADPP